MRSCKSLANETSYPVGYFHGSHPPTPSHLHFGDDDGSLTTGDDRGRVAERENGPRSRSKRKICAVTVLWLDAKQFDALAFKFRKGAR